MEKRCDICNSLMLEGDYGQAKWVCTNEKCEKFDPNWPMKRLQKKLKPLHDEIAEVSKFSSGEIEMYTGRWVGDGSFTVTFMDGREIECHVDGKAVFPDLPEITDEIRSKLFQLIALRERLSQAIDEGI